MTGRTGRKHGVRHSFLVGLVLAIAGCGSPLTGMRATGASPVVPAIARVNRIADRGANQARLLYAAPRPLPASGSRPVD